jgi:prepilin peptidase CpaA
MEIDINKLPLLVLVLWLGYMALVDIKYHAVSNTVIISGLIISVLLHLLLMPENLPNMLLGMAAGFGLLLIPFLMGHMGGADLKIFAVIGSYLGVNATLSAFIYTLIAGAVFVLAYKLLFKQHTVKMNLLHNSNISTEKNNPAVIEKQAIPYVPVIMTGVIMSLLIPLRWSI